ncbi:MAG TPA: LPS assembly protein LptD [Thermoanaerobaculia bacterium]|nr:LPS assembly protein LptD [Thermoanaerobaculia bacterium]
MLAVAASESPRRRSASLRRLGATLLCALLAAAAGAVEPAPATAAAAEEAPATQDVPAAPGAPAAEQAPAAPAPPRVELELHLPEQDGGGSVKGAAASLETDGPDRVVLSGAVELRYQDLVLTADRVLFVRSEQRVVAEGSIVLDQGPRRLTGRTLTLHLPTKTGTLTEATAFLEPDISFSGSEIEKTGERTYEVRDGTLTACLGDATPDWSFRLTSAKVEMEAYAHIYNASMWVKKTPVLYFPYLLYPTVTDRASGLLVPNLGYSKRRGAYVGLAYFQTLGASWDTTFHYDSYGEGYHALGNELRYHPTEGTSGRSELYFVQDPVADDWRWKASWDHLSEDLPLGLRGVVSFRDFSDFDFFRDFERGANLSTVRRIPSVAYLAGAWGQHALTLQADRMQTFVSSDTILDQRRLPEAFYTLNKRKLGRTPLYLSIDSTAGVLSNDRGDGMETRYGRGTFNPALTLPLRAFPWLNVSLAAAGGFSWWSESLADYREATEGRPAGFYCGDQAVARGTYCGESFSRAIPSSTAEVIGPVFTRIFEVEAGGFSKFKHIIEPRWGWTYVGESDENERIPLFDERDRTYSSTNLGEVSLVNRLLAKPADPEQGGAREILSFELSQAFALDDQALQRSQDGNQTSNRSALFATLRLNPADALSLQAQAEYSTLFSGLEATQLTATLALDRARLGLSWYTRYRAEMEETSSDQLRVTAGVTILPNRLLFDAQLNYDILSGDLQQQYYALVYNSQCWGIRLEAREFNYSDRRDRDFRFALSLKNVGTFLDLTGGDTTLY